MVIILVIIAAFSTYDIRKLLNLVNQKIEFKLDGVVPAGIYGYALVLTNRLISVSSDG